MGNSNENSNKSTVAVNAVNIKSTMTTNINEPLLTKIDKIRFAKHFSPYGATMAVNVDKVTGIVNATYHSAGGKTLGLDFEPSKTPEGSDPVITILEAMQELVETTHSMLKQQIVANGSNLILKAVSVKSAREALTYQLTNSSKARKVIPAMIAEYKDQEEKRLAKIRSLTDEITELTV